MPWAATQGGGRNPRPSSPGTGQPTTAPTLSPHTDLFTPWRKCSPAVSCRALRAVARQPWHTAAQYSSSHSLCWGGSASAPARAATLALKPPCLALHRHMLYVLAQRRRCAEKCQAFAPPLVQHSCTSWYAPTPAIARGHAMFLSGPLHALAARARGWESAELRDADAALHLHRSPELRYVEWLSLSMQRGAPSCQRGGCQRPPRPA